MSTLSKTVDLTFYGCPLHYIKAREAVKKLALEASLILEVNKGDAVKEVMSSLRQDGHICEIESEGKLTTFIKVTKKHG
jgi:TusA-related sulfurtransferase